jgi:glycerophosphoryl diester phosphodiesterase
MPLPAFGRSLLLLVLAGLALAQGPRLVGHRGAPAHYPEESLEGVLAAAAFGAFGVECDAVPTRDGALVCRHAFDDLAETTNVLMTPWAKACKAPFRPAGLFTRARARCRTVDLSLKAFLSLEAWPEGKNDRARRAEDYFRAARYPASLFEAPAHPLDHAGFVRVLKPLKVAYFPELKKSPLPPGTTRGDLRRALVDAYKKAGIPPERVFMQSFDREDLAFWRAYAPLYARQAIWLDGRKLDPEDPASWHPGMAALHREGIRYLGPPIRYLLRLEGGHLRPTAYARAAKAAGLLLVPWTLERTRGLGSPEELYAALGELGAFAVFSDDPGRYR